MKNKDRYKTAHLTEDQFEPGSRGRVLRNRLGITLKREMDIIEKKELHRTLEKLISLYDEDSQFRAADLSKIHRIWLGGIYEWAGQYRNVNITKDGFTFAAALHLPGLMKAFENGPLRECTLCSFNSHLQVARALAVVHTEFVLIHPFREGNGRTARLLSNLMALQAGLPPLDFGGITGKKKEYISAIHAGLDHNYDEMEKIFMSVIRRTLRIHGRV